MNCVLIIALRVMHFHINYFEFFQFFGMKVSGEISSV